MSEVDATKTNVVSIGRGYDNISVGDAPVPGVVEQLEELLEMARSGKLQAVAVAGIDNRGSPLTRWRQSYQYAGLPMVGCISYLHHEYLANWLNK